MTWLAGVEVIAGQSAGDMSGAGGRKLLLHSTEGSTIAGAVAAYRTRNVWPHLTVDCPRRRIVQHLPLDVAGRSLRNKPGGVETNRAGRVLVQIEMVGFAETPESIGSDADLDWFGVHVVRPIHQATGVPLVTQVAWRPYPASYGEAAPQRVPAAAWAGLEGLVGHQHAPENDHGDPGALDVDRVLAAANDQPSEEDDMTPAEANEVLVTAIQKPGHPFRVEFAKLVDSRLALYKVARQGDVVADVDEAALAEHLLTTLTPDAIATALGPDLGDEVVDAIHRRTAPAG